jgi:DNA-binding XRE family transcriptional regulator
MISSDRRDVIMDLLKIGKFVAELRHEAGITQEALGQRIGVTNKTVSRWETGSYMPDIEMCKVLSDLFHISINELLCGERLDDRNFRQKADSNLLAALKGSCFSIKERSDFWRQKWLREHIALIILSAAVPAGIFIWACFLSIYWLAGICPAGWMVIYAVWRNRMMIYIESKIYADTERVS